MNCPNCKAHNLASARLCAECGSTVAVPDDKVDSTQDEGSRQAAGSTTPYFPAPTDRQTGQFTPMDIRQLVNETFLVCRTNFGVLLRIVLVAHIPFIAANFIYSSTVAGSLGIAGLFTGLLANGAITYVVSQYYLGHKVTAAGGYVAALNYALSLLAAAIIFFSAMLGALTLWWLLIGIPMAVYISAAWFFYGQAIMIERARPLAALGRSWRLVRGTWMRVFGIGVVFVLLQLAAGLFLSLPGFLLAAANATLGGLLITLGFMLATPIFGVGAVLVYLDLRARKEGYSLEMLASEIG